MTEPIIIPVADRYGRCESTACESRLFNRITEKKPMFIYAGQRLCRDCVRRTRRNAEAS